MTATCRCGVSTCARASELCESENSHPGASTASGWDWSPRGVGAATVSKALAILSGVCRFAVLRGLIDANPVREVRKPSCPPPAFRRATRSVHGRAAAGGVRQRGAAPRCGSRDRSCLRRSATGRSPCTPVAGRQAELRSGRACGREGDREKHEERPPEIRTSRAASCARLGLVARPERLARPGRLPVPQQPRRASRRLRMGQLAGSSVQAGCSKGWRGNHAAL